MIGLGKRGIQLSMWGLVEMILIIGITVPLFLFISDVQGNTFFERNILAKDLALIMDTVQSMPGEVYYTYHNELLPNFNYSFKENEVVVSIFETRKNSYPFYHAKGLGDVYIKDFGQPSSLSFTKAKNILNVEEGIGGLVRRDECPAPNGEKISENGIVFLYPADEDSKETAGSVNDFLNVNSFVKENGLASGAELTVLIAFKSSEEDSSIYYLNGKRNSRALSCFIRNALVEDFDGLKLFPGTGLSLTRGDISEYVAVLIEADPDYASEISAGVKEAIGEYDEALQ